jgi:Tol biopolymer transport system component/DNA-binding winged helix-turn-helix (wHTH) protein
MEHAGPASGVISFEEFEVDFRSGELRRHGERIKLQEQPFQILQILLERPGELVTREQLRKRVWPADTFVDFDHGLYSAMARLREALSDSAEEPRFIETRARRGYRFIGSINETVVAKPRNPASDPEFVSTVDEQEAATRVTQVGQPPAARKARQPLPWIMLALVILAGSAAWKFLGGRVGESAAGKTVTFRRLTDFVGLEEFPAISPDRKAVAFTADVSGIRHIWVRLLAGGEPLQITRDTGEHLYPRWSPDSAFIIFYSPPQAGETQGTISEVSALGGTHHRLASSIGGGDVSHDGKKLAFFRLNDNRMELVVADRDGSNLRVLCQLTSNFRYLYPRWSPGDRWIAYQRVSLLWMDDIFLASTNNGENRQVTREGVLMSGLAWAPDASGIVYSSARGSTILYLPTMHLWLKRLDGSEPRELTYGEDSDANPDLDSLGRVFASRTHRQFDIWKYPVDSDGASNVNRGVRITQQTGQVQTPTVSPKDTELAYLSDSGGHGNLWITRLDDGERRQITYEQNSTVTMGVPVWSPDGRNIVFVSTRNTSNWAALSLWLVNPDGSNLRNIVKEVAGWANWSVDGHWLYYTAREGDVFQLLKVAVDGGTPTTVRNDNAWSSAITADGSTLYYVVPLQNVTGVVDYEIRVARPEGGPSRLLARIPGGLVPDWQVVQPVLSHDGKWLALLLNDGPGTNVWVLSTCDGKQRRVTDFGKHRVFIARRLSWSSDDNSLFAAVGTGDSDIIELDALLP